MNTVDGEYPVVSYPLVRNRQMIAQSIDKHFGGKSTEKYKKKHYCGYEN